ncbi:MAG: ArsB/NhaD family transporter [Spirochaetes bacterium]|nr:ArsB/NhaD family transporter [Spirochaetota bacterium]MBU1082176.1 ArsB/NhaD family transporter [Spirochaetota bacterium]
MQSSIPVALVIFIVSMIAITTEKVHKTSAAILGGMLMVIFGLESQSVAFSNVDWNVIFLLIGMMIITSITKRTGLFQYIAIRLAKLARGEPVAIILMLSVATAVISALLDNVTTVLILVPITFLIAVELNVAPTPFVVALALASNVGGTATLIGDPPNIMIGSAAGLGFSDFLAYTAPVVVVNLVALCAFIFLVFRKSLVVTNERKARILAFDHAKAIEDKPLLVKSLVVLGAVMAAFVLHSRLGLEPSTIALSGAAVLLIASGTRDVEAILGEIEWTTIMFFLGLFMLVGGLVETGIMTQASASVLGATTGHMGATTMLILWASGLLSGILDNIPFVATMIPLIQDMGVTLGASAVRPLWWALSLGACLGGNGTLIGASANVVAVGISRKNGNHISFWDFTKYSAVYTVISLAVSSAYMLIRF